MIEYRFGMADVELENGICRYSTRRIGARKAVGSFSAGNGAVPANSELE